MQQTKQRGAMSWVGDVAVIFGKDLRAELRTKEALNASLSFALVILLLFSFAFDPSSEQTHDIAGGLLWIVYAFAGTLILNRSFVRELPNDCLDGLIAAPIPAWTLFLGKEQGPGWNRRGNQSVQTIVGQLADKAAVQNQGSRERINNPQQSARDVVRLLGGRVESETEQQQNDERER